MAGWTGRCGGEEFEDGRETVGVAVRTPPRSRGGSCEEGLKISTVGSQILDSAGSSKGVLVGRKGNTEFEGMDPAMHSV